jgi:hypothetical protein
MDHIEAFIAELILKTLHKSSPMMSPADDAKVTKTVADFVTAGLDLVSIYFVIRNSRK